MKATRRKPKAAPPRAPIARSALEPVAHAPPQAEPAKPGLLAHALVALAALATFARALPYPLQTSWDDGRFVVDNPAVRAVSLRALRSIFAEPHFEAYHPLHLLAYWLDVPWFGPQPWALHAVSLALWIAALQLLLRVYAGLGLSVTAAVLATLACGLHPVQVEAVSWASGRKDVLALLFSAACVLFHLRATPAKRGFAWLSAACFTLAALSKTTVLPLPAVILLADVLLRGRSPRDALRAQLPTLVLAAGLGAVVIAIWREHDMIRTTAGGLFELPGRVAATFAHQLGTALLPNANAPMYSTTAVAAPDALAWVALAAFAALAAVAHRRGAQRLLFTLGAFALLLLPVSNALPMYFPYQDRYLSLPLLALAFGLGALSDELVRLTASRWSHALAALAVAALALRCVQYQGEWASETRLWGHAVATQPDAYYARMKLGEVRRRAGDLHGAIRAYKPLLQLDPRRKLGYAALFASVAERDERLRGLAPARADRYAERFYAALEDPQALHALARQLLAAGYVRAVELPLQRAIDLEPMPDEALERAAAAQFSEGRASMGWFFLRNMRKASTQPELVAAGERARAAQAASPL